MTTTKLLLVVPVAFCVFCLTWGGVFFVLGGFVLLIVKAYWTFALIVAGPALVFSLFATLVVRHPAMFPSPIGDLVTDSDDGQEAPVKVTHPR